MPCGTPANYNLKCMPVPAFKHAMKNNFTQYLVNKLNSKSVLFKILTIIFITDYTNDFRDKSTTKYFYINNYVD